MSFHFTVVTVAFGNTFSELDWGFAVPELVTHIKGPFQDQRISRKKPYIVDFK